MLEEKYDVVKQSVNGESKVPSAAKDGCDQAPPRRAPGYQVEDLDNLFTYHPPKNDQAERYQKISNAAKEFARVVLENTPACADQTVAIREIIKTRMSANAVIALNE